MIIGIIGKANVGKSTFFKSLTSAEVLIANYPFATIEPNKGFAFVRVECADKEFNVKCNPRYGYCINGKRFVPVEVMDVAGLVPGAHEGKGLGNKFLDDLRQADAFIHVVDMSGSSNEKGEPIEPGSYDPAFDIKFLEFEIDMWFLSIIKKGWDKSARQVQQEKSSIVPILGRQLSGLNIKEEDVNEAVKKLNLNPSRPIDWSEEDLHTLASFLRRQTKPMIIAANKMDIPIAEKNLERIGKEFKDHTIIPCSAEAELTLKEASKKGLIEYVPGNEKFEIKGNLTDQQKKALEFLQKKVLDKFGSTGVQKIIEHAVFNLLKFIAVFPGGVNNLVDQHGNTLPDCFLVPPDTTALDFAFRLHTDLGNKFIRAIDVKTKKTIGKDHVLKHRDVVEIVSGK